jgi:hypothetical protein
METVPSSAALGGSRLALFERSEFSQTPLDASSAGNRAAARAWLAFLWGTFLWRPKEKCLGRRAETRLATNARTENKEMHSRSLPACHDSKNTETEAKKCYE